jgi:NhaP-type Na+/H+ or K+/H+ antiporter
MHMKEAKGWKGWLLWSTQTVRHFTLADIWNAAGLTIILLVLYAGLYLCIGAPFLPGSQGSAWAILVIWIGGHVGGFLAELINVPAPVGMICVGLFLRNAAGAVLITGLKPSWSKEIRGAALAMIFLRSGLELNLSVFKTIGLPAIKLLLIPGLVEAFFNGGMAVALFGMTPLFGFALGFILKAVGPALVIQLMFELQQKRLGTDRRLPTIVVAAASFDDMIAITGYTIFINIAVQGSSNNAWHIAQGPLSVVFGFGLGAIAAFCCSATRLWNNKYKRVLALVISALTMKYFFDQFDFESGGALAALMLGLVVKEFWRRQWPRCLALQNDEPDENIRQAEHAVRFLWRFILMPLLFTLVGTIINFSTLSSSTIQKACSLVFAGLGVRMVTTLLVMKTSHFAWLECFWFAIAWTPKATVQAALGQLPSDAVARAYPVGSLDHDRYVQFGTDALTTAVFEIIISGTLGCLMVRWLSPLLLKLEPEDAAIKRAKSAVLVTSEPSMALERGYSASPDFGGFDHSNIVEDHVQRLEQLATALISTGSRDDDEEARLYGQRLKAGVRALTSRLHYEIIAKDVIGADAYQEAVQELQRRERGGLAGASSRRLADIEANAASGAQSSRHHPSASALGEAGPSEDSGSIDNFEHVARSA